MKKYDVVIVGFGPTGGTLANLLALHGFSILVLSIAYFSFLTILSSLPPGSKPYL